MIEQPFKSVAYSWLAQAGGSADTSVQTEFGQPGWIAYPMPPEMGHGGYELIELALGMSVVRSAVTFTPAVAGQFLSLMDVDVDFNEPSFQAMTFTGVRGRVNESFPEASIAFSPGMDVFRHTQRYLSNFAADASYSGEICHLSVSCKVLERLVGESEMTLILDRLGIAQTPAIVAHRMPLWISALLNQAAAGGLTGNMRRLFAQAKIIEYLGVLIGHLGSVVCPEPERRQKSEQRVQEIHEQLLTSEGKLPTLDELASQYGRSARSLNEEFTLVFGKSIVAFVMDHRLQQAHEALQHSEISIKQLAARLGYAHVSNFTIAFKRRFGYSPGSLRRK